MSESPSDRRDHLVHLACGADQTTAPISARLAASGFPTETFHDPYTALAHVARLRPGALLALIACVDDLCEAEFEFFGILRRDKPALTVIVYAEERRADVLMKLRTEGAQGMDRLDEFLSRQPCQAMAPEVEPLPRTRALRRLSERPAAAPGHQGTRSGTGSAEVEVGGPRVPWLRYDDAPKRTPPRAPATSIRTEADAARAREEGLLQRVDEEPLLTAEELSALLGEVEDEGDSSAGSRPGGWA